MVSKMNIMCNTCLTNTNTIWYVLPWYLHYAYVKYMLRATMRALLSAPSAAVSP